MDFFSVGGGGGSYLPQKSSTVLSEPKFGTPNKKSLGLPLVRGQNVLNNNFLTTVRRTIRKTLMQTSCTFLRSAIIFIAICSFLQLDFHFLSSIVLQVIQNYDIFTSCSGLRVLAQQERLAPRLAQPRVKMNHGVGCRLS